jgi:hypothetical protein
VKYIRVTALMRSQSSLFRWQLLVVLTKQNIIRPAQGQEVFREYPALRVLVTIPKGRA